MAKKSNNRNEDVELEKSYKSVAGKYSKKPSVVWKAFYISTSTNHLSFSKNK